MKKLFLCLMLLLSSLCFAENRENSLYNNKEAIEMYGFYFCPIENVFSKEKCKHEEAKKYLLYNDYVFKKEFENNEQKAINMLADEKNIFLIDGKIKKLSSGETNSSYIIEFENGLNVYIKDVVEYIEGVPFRKISEEQKNMYLQLNKGDYVYVFATDFLMSKYYGKNFMGGQILTEEDATFIIEKIKEINNF